MAQNKFTSWVKMLVNPLKLRCLQLSSTGDVNFWSIYSHVFGSIQMVWTGRLCDNLKASLTSHF